MSKVTGIAVAMNRDECLELFATSGDDAVPDLVWHAWQVAPSSDEWTALQPLGASDGVAYKGVGVARTFQKALQVVVKGRDRTLWTTEQTTPDMEWIPWRPLAQGVEIISVPVLVPEPGTLQLQLFVVRKDKNVWNRRKQDLQWQTSLNFGRPGAGTPGPLAVGVNVDSSSEVFLSEVFTVASDRALWHCWMHETGVSWGFLKTPHDPLKPDAPVVANNADGRLEVFAVRDDGTVWHLWQLVPHGGWSGWSPLERPDAGPVTNIATGANSDGHLILIATQDATLWQRTQTDNGWSQWEPVGDPASGPLQDPTLASAADGGLVLFVRTPSTGGLYRYRQAPNGDWSIGSPWSSPGA